MCEETPRLMTHENITFGGAAACLSVIKHILAYFPNACSMDGDNMHYTTCDMLLHGRAAAYQEAQKNSAVLSLRQGLPPETMLWTAGNRPLQPEGETQQLAGGWPQAMLEGNEHKQAA